MTADVIIVWFLSGVFSFAYGVWYGLYVLGNRPRVIDEPWKK